MSTLYIWSFGSILIIIVQALQIGHVKCNNETMKSYLLHLLPLGIQVIPNSFH